jgi:hypothetical protein
MNPGSTDHETRRVIRVFPEYGIDGPLWDATPEPNDFSYVLVPADLGLSSRLSDRLMQWNQFWADNFGAFEGWASSSARESWRAEGVEVVAELTSEIGYFADIKYEPWPLDA